MGIGETRGLGFDGVEVVGARISFLLRERLEQKKVEWRRKLLVCCFLRGIFLGVFLFLKICSVLWVLLQTFSSEDWRRVRRDVLGS